MSCFPLDPSGPANVNFKQSKECSKVGESFTGYGDSALTEHLAKMGECSRAGEGKHHCYGCATAGAARGLLGNGKRWRRECDEVGGSMQGEEQLPVAHLHHHHQAGGAEVEEVGQNYLAFDAQAMVALTSMSAQWTSSPPLSL